MSIYYIFLLKSYAVAMLGELVTLTRAPTHARTRTHANAHTHSTHTCTHTHSEWERERERERERVLQRSRAICNKTERCLFSAADFPRFDSRFDHRTARKMVIRKRFTLWGLVKTGRLSPDVVKWQLLTDLIPTINYFTDWVVWNNRW